MDAEHDSFPNYPKTLDDIPPDELAHIRANIAWFKRFTPSERLRIGAKQGRIARRLQRMRQVKEEQNGS
jgi:hypothetical protein